MLFGAEGKIGSNLFPGAWVLLIHHVPVHLSACPVIYHPPVTYLRPSFTPMCMHPPSVIYPISHVPSIHPSTSFYHPLTHTLCIHPFIHPSFHHLSPMHLPSTQLPSQCLIHPTNHPPVHLTNHLLICPHIHPIIHPFIYLSIQTSIYLSIHYPIYPTVCPFTHSIIYQSSSPFTHQTTIVTQHHHLPAQSYSFHSFFNNLSYMHLLSMQPFIHPTITSPNRHPPSQPTIIQLSIHLIIIHPSIHVFTYPTIHPPIQPSTHIFILLAKYRCIIQLCPFILSSFPPDVECLLFFSWFLY